MSRAVVAAVLLIIAAVLTPAARATPDDADATITLADGRLDRSEFTRTVARLVGSDRLAVRLAAFAPTIDLRTDAGRLRLDDLEHRSDHVLRFTVRGDELAIDIADEPNAGAALRRWLADEAGVAGDAPPAHGVFASTASGDPTPRNDDDLVPERAVVLVHGLDAPPWQWRELAPALVDAGYEVLFFDYPDDGPIASGADRFAAELELLHDRGLAEIVIVAHSMGGLVSRDLLTRPRHYGGDGSGGERFPAVRQLIMLGTPNGGSAWARLRIVTELRDQAVRLWQEGLGYRGAEADGSGEAAQDLEPGSSFLRALNARPHPDGVKLTVIAGRFTTIETDRLDSVLEEVRDLVGDTELPAWANRLLNGDDHREAAQELSDSVGDGVVTVQSARLTGAALHIVEADHMSMVVNLLPNSKTVPPSIPIVLEELAATGWALPREVNDEGGDEADDDP